jgi:uncharacterized protein (TIGR02996 family)
MSSRQAFLEAIAANLDDDAPRLLFADWLEEHGDPRGEFIRVQCALAGLPADDPRRTDPGAPRGRAVGHARSPLDDRAARGRREGLAGAAHVEARLPTGVRFYVQSFVDKIEAILRQDVVQDLRVGFNLDDDRPDVDDDAWVERLAACPRLRLVSKLDAQESGFGPHRFGILIRSPHLTRLVDLDLFADVIGLEGVQALCASPTPFRLKRLFLTEAITMDEDEETPEAVEAVRVLANSPKLAHLEALGLYYNMLGEHSVAALVASPYLPRPLHLEFEEKRDVPAHLRERLRTEFGSA